ncbi:MAG: YkgJ family cysteine cluster protein [Euryarchaeota archaeon]|nr:YkgJ family cysteine cluster protein [Euryarchaeota archaeon]
MELEVDYVEAAGKGFVCLEGCGYCCLCSPEVERGLVNVFLMDPGLKPALISQGGTHRLKLQGEGGACRFLKDRSCTIYEKRPRYCSSFPFHIHCGTRAQVNVDLSCRGLAGNAKGALGLDGIERSAGRTDALTYAKEVVAKAPVEETLRRSRAAYRRFEEKARERGSYRTQDEIVTALRPLASDLFDRDFLAQATGLPWEDAIQAPYEAAIRVSSAAGFPDYVDETVRSVFETDDIGDLPVYIDPDLGWHLFSIDGSELVQRRLEETGVKETVSRRDVDSIGLRPLEPDARSVLEEYVSLTLSRDIFTGLSYFIVADSGYEIDACQAGLEETVTLATDLWWRASLLSDLAGRKTITARDARDALVFMDMDFLDSQTIGAVI